MNNCKSNDKTCRNKKTLKELNEKLPDEESIMEYQEILKALADPIRLKIIYLLKDGELCVCELLDALDKTQPTISYHLNLLKKSKIIKGRKEGKWTHYSLNNPEIVENLNKIFKN